MKLIASYASRPSDLKSLVNLIIHYYTIYQTIITFSPTELAAFIIGCTKLQLQKHMSSILTKK